MKTEIIIKDMPKLQSPFVREIVNNKYIITPKIEEGYEWVFEGNEDEVLCVEKMDGTNVSIIVENGQVISVYNRLGYVPFINKPKRYIIEGILEACERGYLDDMCKGQFFGEIIGKKVQGNPYNLKGHIWLPFNTYCRKHLTYKSWHKYPKTFENISEWFRKPIEEGGIFSLFMRQSGIDQKPEGVVFHNLKTGQMAKLRLDMFDWWDGKVHKQNQP